MNLEILNHGQVTRTTPDLPPLQTSTHINGKTLSISKNLTHISSSTRPFFSSHRYRTHDTRLPRPLMIKASDTRVRAGRNGPSGAHFANAPHGARRRSIYNSARKVAGRKIARKRALCRASIEKPRRNTRTLNTYATKVQKKRASMNRETERGLPFVERIMKDTGQIRPYSGGIAGYYCSV
ncbi:hypothetical protein TNCV_3980651 [Trichonephila clavipes]|nr:hypothetical protein TNCV_3980651 [Trichonephila clavipes]